MTVESRCAERLEGCTVSFLTLMAALDISVMCLFVELINPEWTVAYQALDYLHIVPSLIERQESKYGSHTVYVPALACTDTAH